MAMFVYEAVMSSGRLMNGRVEASHTEQAKVMLEGMGLSVNQLEMEKETPKKSALGRSEFLLFNQQLASLTKAGVPLDKGIRELVSDMEQSTMKKALTEVADALEKGVGLNEALEMHKNDFPPEYVKVVKAGIESGRLTEMLKSMNRHMEVRERTKKVLVEALTYPAILFVIMNLIIVGIYILIIPFFRVMYVDMAKDCQLPAVTSAVLWFSDHFVTIFMTCVCVVGVIVLVIYMLRQSSGGRYWVEGVLLKVPVLGRLYRVSILSRLADVMGLLVGSGSDIGEAIDAGGGISGSEQVRAVCRTVKGQLDMGGLIGEVRSFGRMIPNLFWYSIQLGIQRNELQDNLYLMSDMYAEQAKHYQVVLTQVITPVLIVLLGIVVSFTVLGLFMPMITLLRMLGDFT